MDFLSDKVLFSGPRRALMDLLSGRRCRLNKLLSYNVLASMQAGTMLVHTNVTRIYASIQASRRTAGHGRSMPTTAYVRLTDFVYTQLGAGNYSYSIRSIDHLLHGVTKTRVRTDAIYICTATAQPHIIEIGMACLQTCPQTRRPLIIRQCISRSPQKLTLCFKAGRSISPHSISQLPRV